MVNELKINTAIEANRIVVFTFFIIFNFFKLFTTLIDFKITPCFFFIGYFNPYIYIIFSNFYYFQFAINQMPKNMKMQNEIETIITTPWNLKSNFKFLNPEVNNS